jgi:hypothetical protein
MSVSSKLLPGGPRPRRPWRVTDLVMHQILACSCRI